MNIIKEIRYKSCEEFIKAISYNGDLYNKILGNYLFRGHASDSYELLPTLLRPSNKQIIYNLSGLFSSELVEEWDYGLVMRERIILKKFYKMCDDRCLPIPEIPALRQFLFTDIDNAFINQQVWLPSYLYDLAALAQHYGLPTRLLDWTQDLFVALYFASIGVIEKEIKEKNDFMVIWALYKEADVFNTFPPLKIIKPRYWMNPNLGAQQGAFSLWQIKTPIKQQHPYLVDVDARIDRSPLDELMSKYIKEDKDFNYLYKLMIPSYEAVKVYDFLKHIHYDASKLFPGYQGVQRCMRDDSLVSSLRNKME